MKIGGFQPNRRWKKLLKALIVLGDERPPLTHELRPLAAMARRLLSDDPLNLQV